MTRRFNAYGSMRHKKPVGLSADLALAPTTPKRHSPDAALLAACDAFMAVQGRLEALTAEAGRMPDAEFRAAAEALEAERWPLVLTMAELRAVTFEGVVARLNVLRLGPAELEPCEESMEMAGLDERLLRLMLRDMAAIYGPRA
jgi:hypothetical protein